jgi:hypothetical protein
MSSPISTTPISGSMANALVAGSPAAALDEISNELATLMQRTARIAQRTIQEMGQKAQGSPADVLEAVRLLSRLKEQCQEALATAQLSLPSQEEEAQSVQKLLSAMQEASSEEILLEVMGQIAKEEPTLGSSVGRSLRVLAETRLASLRQRQDPSDRPCDRVLQGALALRQQHRAAGEAIRALSRVPSLTGAMERVGLAGVARVIDSDMTQAMQVCRRHLDLLASQQEQIHAGMEAHQEQLRQTRRTLAHYGLELERAQAVQSGAQGLLLERAGAAMEILSLDGIRALERVHQEALKTQLALEKLALQPIQAACRTAAGLQGAYGAIRGAMMSLSEREALVHTLENWLLSAHTHSSPVLFAEPLSKGRWASWSVQGDAMVLRDQPRWMGWTFEALGLAHPEVPQGLGWLTEVLESYCVARELLLEMEPDYDAEGTILQSLRTMLQAEHQKWLAWAEMGLATDHPADGNKLLELGTGAIPSPGLLQAIGDWQARTSAQAQTVAERMQRLHLGDWRKGFTLHPSGTLHAWVSDWGAQLEPEKTLQHWEQLLAETRGQYRNGWGSYQSTMLAIARTRSRLHHQLRQAAPAALSNLQSWLTEHGQGLERLLRERALDLTKLGAPIVTIPLQDAKGEFTQIALRMPPGLEEAFISALGSETLAAIRRAEILGLGHLSFQPGYGMPGMRSLHWDSSPGSEVRSAAAAAKRTLEGVMHYFCGDLAWHWVDLSGQKRHIGSFRWRDHGSNRQYPVHAPAGFAIQDDSDCWAHPAELIRVIQKALDGLCPVTAAMDYLAIYGDQYECGSGERFHGGYCQWPLDRDQHPNWVQVSEAVLWHVERLTGLSSSELNRRFQQAQPLDWRGEAHDAQVRMLAYLDALHTPAAETVTSLAARTTAGVGTTEEPAQPSSLLDHLIADAARRHPARSEVWQALEEEARLCIVGDPGPEAAGPHPTASQPWSLRPLPRFSMEEVEGAFQRLEKLLRSQGR